MRPYHATFYVPIILIWGSVMLSIPAPRLVQSDIRFDPDIERQDLMRIDPGGSVAIDDLVIYRFDWIDYVARVIGLPGDQIVLGLDGNSILRNGERIVLASRGFQIAMNDSGMLEVGDGEAAVYVQNARRNPFATVISQDAIRGPVEKIYRYTNLSLSDWITIGFDSLLVLVLAVMPYVAYVRQRSQTPLRLVILVTHTFMTLVIVAALVATSLPDDPLRLGVTNPMWWWFPLSVVTGFSLRLALVVALFLAWQWLRLNRPWRRGGSSGEGTG